MCVLLVCVCACVQKWKYDFVCAAILFQQREKENPTSDKTRWEFHFIFHIDRANERARTHPRGVNANSTIERKGKYFIVNRNRRRMWHGMAWHGFNESENFMQQVKKIKFI